MSLSIGSLQFEEQWLRKQLRKDLKDDWFPDPQLFSDMIDSGILAKIIEENFSANQGRYVASRSTLFNLPKPNFTLRYSLEMSIQDRMLYQGAASYLMPYFDPCLNWKVFSHRYENDRSSERGVFKPHVEAWKSFIGGVRAALPANKVLVTTDISNYYEHIEISRLSDTFKDLLPEISAAPEQKGRVRDCLERLFEWLAQWSFSSVRGLPQNRDASSFLANIYLVPVDRAVIATGNEYFRYMDDIKIVCSDIPSARRVLKALIVALRERGLSVNARKTDILEGRDPKVFEHLGELSPGIQALDAVWNTRSRWPIFRSLPSLQTKTLELIKTGQTQSKDFRFCIRRLTWVAGCKDFPVPPGYFAEITAALLRSLDSAPASTDEFVDYLSVASLNESELESISEYLVDPRLRIYTWQDYRLWLVLLRQGKRDQRLIDTSTGLIQSGVDSASRAGASLYLGRFGTAEEKETAGRLFSALTSFLGQRSAIIGIHELPFRPLIKECVAPYVRPDLSGVYRNLQRTKGRYIRELEDFPVARFIDQESGYAS